MKSSTTLDGVLLVDKPQGPTSHDVVARIRRATGERAIGHTGTLDPRATGLLPLVVGRATRIASWLSGGDKRYEATIQLGFSTDTDDADGQRVVESLGPVPGAAAVLEGLSSFRGLFEQLPPAHSAKKIGGAKAYDLARRHLPVPLKPVPVTVRALDVIDFIDERLRIDLTVTAGFYVRSLARDLGALLGCGAHLFALRRTASGTFSITDAIPLADAEAQGAALASRLIEPAAALSGLASVTATALGLTRVRHGNSLGPGHVERGNTLPTGDQSVRVLGPDGRLVAVARAEGGALHPILVLG